MPRGTGKTRKKVGNSRPGKNRRRQKAAAKNLAEGMTPQEALVEAGYSESYARSHSYAVVKRPYIQSILTDACDRVLKNREMEFDALLDPYFDALKAKVIVKSQQLGDAQEIDLPDHQTRMNAADRLVELYGGTSKGKTQGNTEWTLEELVMASRENDANGNRISGKHEKETR